MEDYGTDASSHVASRVGYDDSSSGGGDHDGEVKKRMMISPRLSTKGDKRSDQANEKKMQRRDFGSNKIDIKYYR